MASPQSTQRCCRRYIWSDLSGDFLKGLFKSCSICAIPDTDIIRVSRVTWIPPPSALVARSRANCPPSTCRGQARGTAPAWTRVSTLASTGHVSPGRSSGGGPRPPSTTRRPCRSRVRAWRSPPPAAAPTRGWGGHDDLASYHVIIHLSRPTN